MNLKQINTDSSIPKYKQIVKAVQHAIDEHACHQGDQLPSMNHVCATLDVSRETVFKAYQELKSLGIISSSPGKGYFVSAAPGLNKRNIFLLLDSFSAYKEVLYNSFTATLGSHSVVDVYFHHFNTRVFHSLLREALGKYTDYVVMPLTSAEEKNWLQQTIDSDNLYILDTGWELYGHEYASVCQNFSKETFEALSQLTPSLLKYKEIVLVWGDASNPFKQQIKDKIVHGLQQFCSKVHMNWRLEARANASILQPGTCYIMSYDFDLVEIVQQSRQKKLKLGTDIGILSFNESPLKAIVGENGITTFSTDFAHMGKAMAELVISKQKQHIENPFRLIDRKSL